MTREDSTGAPWARFDDLRAGTALRFPPPQRVVVARSADEVVPALDAVGAATYAGAWAYGYVAYEAAPGLDPALAAHPPEPGGMPLVWFGLGAPPEEVAPVVPQTARTARTAATSTAADWWPAWTPQEHARGVARVRERIATGDTYQTNLTVRLRGAVRGDPLDLYAALALRQDGAHNAFLHLGRWAVASASPELFLERRGDDLLLRPMKGTAPRGSTPQEDAELARRLLASAKERAENVMVVDLLRNDASRVAVPGTVAVPALLALERYPTVHQMTSDVTARLRPGTGLTHLFRALFPSGSVTGTPKSATMSLIRELEPTPRGVYCGAVGWVAPPGEPVSARFGVAIRTAVVDRSTGEGVYGVGSGITWGSDARAEHDEVLAKTRVLTG